MKWLLLSLLAGCSLLSSPAAAPIITSAIEVAAQTLRDQTGRTLEDIPHECELENHPASGELLMLCTFCYRDGGCE